MAGRLEKQQFPQHFYSRCSLFCLSPLLYPKGRSGKSVNKHTLWVSSLRRGCGLELRFPIRSTRLFVVAFRGTKLTCPTIRFTRPHVMRKAHQRLWKPLCSLFAVMAGVLIAASSGVQAHGTDMGTGVKLDPEARRSARPTTQFSLQPLRAHICRESDKGGGRERKEEKKGWLKPLNCFLFSSCQGSQNAACSHPQASALISRIGRVNNTGLSSISTLV